MPHPSLADSVSRHRAHNDKLATSYPSVPPPAEADASRAADLRETRRLLEDVRRAISRDDLRAAVGAMFKTLERLVDAS